MFSKVSVFVALFAVAFAGQEAPPAKAVSYNVPTVAKVSYPGPTVTRSVETYSAPSIEKTVLITRTITAPLNAPAVKTVSYAAPAAPVAVAAAPVGLAAAPAYAAGPAYAAVPAYAAGPAYAAAPLGIAPAGIPALQTTYGAPGLGLSLGGGAPHLSFLSAGPAVTYSQIAAAPVAYSQVAAAPVAYSQVAAAPVAYSQVAAAPVAYSQVGAQAAYAAPGHAKGGY